MHSLLFPNHSTPYCCIQAILKSKRWTRPQAKWRTPVWFWGCLWCALLWSVLQRGTILPNNWALQKKACCSRDVRDVQKGAHLIAKQQTATPFLLQKNGNLHTPVLFLSWILSGENTPYSPCSLLEILEDCKDINKQHIMPSHVSMHYHILSSTACLLMATSCSAPKPLKRLLAHNSCGLTCISNEG